MEQEIKLTEKETYIFPDIEVVEIEIEQFLEASGSITDAPADNKWELDASGEEW